LSPAFAESTAPSIVKLLVMRMAVMIRTLSTLGLNLKGVGQSTLAVRK
jgi:hypothetical protein